MSGHLLQLGRASCEKQLPEIGQKTSELIKLNAGTAVMFSQEKCRKVYKPENDRVTERTYSAYSQDVFLIKPHHLCLICVYLARC